MFHSSENSGRSSRIMAAREKSLVAVPATQRITRIKCFDCNGRTLRRIRSGSNALVRGIFRKSYVLCSEECIGVLVSKYKTRLFH